MDDFGNPLTSTWQEVVLYWFVVSVNLSIAGLGIVLLIYLFINRLRLLRKLFIQFLEETGHERH